MKNCFTLLLLCCSLTAFSQQVEKKGTFSHHFELEVFHPDSAYATALLQIGSWGVVNEDPIGIPDTFVYQMKAFDSVVAQFGLYDDFFLVGYDGSDPFGERLLFGAPVYNFQHDDGTYGDSYERIWAFTDSALFGFSMNLSASPAAPHTQYVKLIGPPETPAPAVVEEPEPAAPFLVYPNPCNGEVTILQPEDLVTQFELVDASGRTIREWYAAGTQTVDVSELQSGMYLLRVRNSVYPGNVRLQKM